MHHLSNPHIAELLETNLKVNLSQPVAFCGFRDVVLTRIIHENLMCNLWF